MTNKNPYFEQITTMVPAEEIWRLNPKWNFSLRELGECILYTSSPPPAPAKPRNPDKCIWWLLFFAENIVRIALEDADREGARVSEEEKKRVIEAIKKAQQLYRKAITLPPGDEKRRLANKIFETIYNAGIDPW